MLPILEVVDIDGNMVFPFEKESSRKKGSVLGGGLGSVCRVLGVSGNGLNCGRGSDVLSLLELLRAPVRGDGKNCEVPLLGAPVWFKGGNDVPNSLSAFDGNSGKVRLCCVPPMTYPPISSMSSSSCRALLSPIRGDPEYPCWPRKCDRAPSSALAPELLEEAARRRRLFISNSPRPKASSAALTLWEYAKSAAVKPAEFLTEKEQWRSISSFTTVRWPQAEAKCRAVLPSLSGKSISAPRSRRSCDDASALAHALAILGGQGSP